MKSVYLLWLVLLLISISSCDNPQPPIEPDSSAEYAVIKIDSALFNNIIVSPILRSISWGEHTKYNTVLVYNEDTLALPNTQAYENGYNPHDGMIKFFQDHLKLTGTSPYIQLEGGYAIVDWKWRTYHPIAADWIYITIDSHKLPDGYSPYWRYNENEKFYLLDKKWSELTDLREMWLTAEVDLFNRPEIIYISIEKIDSYRGESSGVITDGLKLSKVYREYLDNGINACNTLISKYDSLETIFVETLNEMIRKNVLDSYSMVY